MKLSKKTFSFFLLFLFLGILAGTLIWELFQRIIQVSGNTNIDLTIGPIGFDVHVLSVYIRLNIGSLPGGIAGGILFSKI